jgi:hypothetical protein
VLSVNQIHIDPRHLKSNGGIVQTHLFDSQLRAYLKYNNFKEIMCQFYKNRFIFTENAENRKKIPHSKGDFASGSWVPWPLILSSCELGQH